MKKVSPLSFFAPSFSGPLPAYSVPRSSPQPGRARDSLIGPDLSTCPITLADPAPQAYELSTLTGTQVLLLVVSETGLVYTFTTAKLQPLVTQPEGKNLIQACLNAPHGAMPSSLPVGAPLGRSAPGSGNNAGGGIGMGGGPSGPGRNNVPGGLAIAGGEKDPDPDHQDDDGRDDGEPTAAAVARAQAQAQAQVQAHGQQQRRPSNASAPDDLKSPTQSHRKPSLSSQTGPGVPNPNSASQAQPGSASPTSPHPLSALPPLQSHHAAHYPYSAPVGLGNVNVPLDPTMYAQHHSHYGMQGAGQGAQGTQGAQGGQQAYMGGGGGHWSPTSQAGYARR